MLPSLFIHYNGLAAYEKAKRELGRYNFQWKRIAGRKYIGCCSYLYEKLRPSSYQDFFEKYIKDGEDTYGNPDISPEERGRTMDEITSLAERYRSLVGNFNIPLETYVDDIVMHTIIQTFNGQHAERVVKDALETSGFTVERGTKEEDTLMNIDMKVYGKHSPNVNWLIQVKPVSTFTGNYNFSLREDRSRFFLKHEKGHELYPNAPYFYILYKMGNEETDNIYWVHKKGSDFKFTLDELCDTNGVSKFDIKNFELKKKLEK